MGKTSDLFRWLDVWYCFQIAPHLVSLKSRGRLELQLTPLRKCISSWIYIGHILPFILPTKYSNSFVFATSKINGLCDSCFGLPKNNVTSDHMPSFDKIVTGQWNKRSLWSRKWSQILSKTPREYHCGSLHQSRTQNQSWRGKQKMLRNWREVSTLFALVAAEIPKKRF